MIADPGQNKFKLLFAQPGRMLNLLDVSMHDFILPACFGVGATILKLATLVLFLPLVFGLLGGDFSRLDRILPLSSFFPSGDTQAMIWSLSAVILLAAVLNGICSYIARTLVARRGQATRRTLSRKLIDAYLHYGQQYFDLKRFGGILAKTAKFPARGEQFFVFLNQLLQSVMALVLYLVVMAWISLPLTLLIVAVLFLYLYAFHVITNRFETLGDQVSDAEDEVVAVASDYILNLSQVRIAGAEEQARAAFRDVETSVYAARIEESRIEAVIDPLRDLLTMMVLLLVAIITSQFVQDIDVATASRFIIFFLLFRRAMSHFSTILSAPARWKKLQERFTKLFDLLSEEDKYIVPSGDRVFPGLGGGLEIRGLNFSYAGKPGVLQDLSLRIPAGQRTVIVGSTGSGKSTLFRLLLRQYDCPPGAIFVNGKDLRELDTRQWLQHVAYSGAHPQFFNDSVRNNLTVGLNGLSDEALEAAAEKALALDFIRELDGGWDHKIGDSARLLSSGEQQRLALTRMFLRDAELVLLDEATSALDSLTEARILKSIDEYSAQRTLVMIAHRLSNLRDSDHVIVLKQGRVAEQGNKDELLSSSGLLSRLWHVHLDEQA